jgi:hypothetical protein
MKKIVSISTAAFLAGATTLAVTLPMPQGAQAGAQTSRSAELPARPTAERD